MFERIYVEKAVSDHFRTKKILERFPKATVIECESYREVFNRRGQNFRLQKRSPQLMLAQKQGNFSWKTPEGYGIGGENNYYFSHMLNCIYDCRYCFLQGMYQSAHFVLFINFEEFFSDFYKRLEEHQQEVYFFSGYDCDSLALDQVTRFIDEFIPFFQNNPRAILELRTKSVQIGSLLEKQPLENCVVAFTLTPKEIGEALEHKAPSLSRRLEAAKKLEQRGWKIGLRFDPMIYCGNFRDLYASFFQQVFAVLDPKKIHSVSLGTFRLPKAMFDRMRELYPHEKLFTHYLDEGKTVSYGKEREQELISFCEEKILQHIAPHQFFPIGEPV